MAYFLKQSTIKKGVYLQIYESYYHAEKKTTAHRSYKALGYVEELKAKGIADPVEYYREEVRAMNDKAKEKKSEEAEKLLVQEVPYRHFGFFLLKQVMNTLQTEKLTRLIQKGKSNLQFDLYAMLEGLAYARVISPLETRKALSYLYGEYDFTDEQIVEALTFLGSEYELFVELFRLATEEHYGLDESASSYAQKVLTIPSGENKRGKSKIEILFDAHEVPFCLLVLRGDALSLCQEEMRELRCDEIKELFKGVEAEISALPASLQNEALFRGIYLVTYVALLLLRILQKEMPHYSLKELLALIRGFDVVQYASNRFINMTRRSDLVMKVAKDTSLPVANLYLSPAEMKRIMGKKLLGRT